jgi:hypothetical protein
VTFSADVTGRADFDGAYMRLQLVGPDGTVFLEREEFLDLPAVTTTLRMTLPPLDITEAHRAAHLRAEVFEYRVIAATATADYPGSADLEVIKVVEDAEAKAAGGEWQPVVAGMRLGAGTQISTGPFSSVHLLFPDRSVMILKEMTEVRINVLIRQGNGLKAQIVLKIGEVSSQVDPKKVVSSDFSVSTPIATASIRGTIFTVRAVAQPIAKAIVLVTEGKVEVDPVAAGLPTVFVEAGQIVRVTNTVALETLPKLSFNATAGQFKLNWPVSSTATVLETTSALNTALPWTNGGSPVQSGGMFSVTAPIGGAHRFFRLRYVLDGE